MAHPKGFLPLMVSSIFENFGYVALTSALILFLSSKFGISDQFASIIYSFFTGGVCLLSLVGGTIADRTQNYVGSIFGGSLIMLISLVALAIPVNATASNTYLLIVTTCIILCLFALGKGFINGNMHALVGRLYDKAENEIISSNRELTEEVKSHRDAGFQILYLFQSLGSITAPFIVPLFRRWWLAQSGLKYVAELPTMCHDYLRGNLDDSQIADLSTQLHNAGVTSNLSISSCEHYLDVFNQGIHLAFAISAISILVTLSLIYHYRELISASSCSVITPSQNALKSDSETSWKRFGALLVALCIIVFFWIAYHQKSVTLSFFARDLVYSSSIPPETWHSVVSFFIVTLAPLIIALFNFFAKRNVSFSATHKIATGICSIAIGYAILAFISFEMGFPNGDVIENQELSSTITQVSPIYLIIVFFLFALGNLLVAPVGIALVSRIAPHKNSGLCQGLWLVAESVGNMLLPIGTLLYHKLILWQCWGIFSIAMIIAAAAMLSLQKRLT